MEKIVPRWEWRTFCQNFGAPGEFAAASPKRRSRLAKRFTWLPQAATLENVKIYATSFLDIKLLERVDANGLEQWRPVLKSPFPVDVKAIALVKSALELQKAATDRGGLSLDQLLEEFAPSCGPVRIVSVSKTRTRYHVEGCVAELTDVVANGKNVRTVAIEDADAVKVIAAVRAIKLEGYPNTSYPNGLKQVIGLANLRAATSRQAVIDVGTNSVKFHIGERKPDGAWTTIVDRAEVTRLGEGIEKTGSITHEAMERTAQAIANMNDEAVQNGVDGLTAVGTMGLRRRKNAGEFHRARFTSSSNGIAIEVISGEGRRPDRVPGRPVGNRPGPRPDRHLRHRRRELTVHVRAGREGRPAIQRQRGCREVHREFRARPSGDAGSTGGSEAPVPLTCQRSTAPSLLTP